MARETSNLRAVRELVETYKCNPECQNVHGITPLHCASYCGRLSVVKCLVDKHKCNAKVRDEDGSSPLAYTSYCVVGNITLKCPLDIFHKHVLPCNKHIHTAKFLLSHSTLQQASLTHELCILRLPLRCGSFAEFEQFKSFLSLKLGNNSPELCCELAKCVELALDYQLETKSTISVESLLRAYAKLIRVPMNSDTEQSSTSTIIHAFHKACSNADIELIKLFFELDVCKPDAHSVKIAIDKNDYELVELLLQSADHPLLLDRFEGWSSMFLYIHLNCDEQFIRLVVDATIGTDIRDAEGNTPLHLLCKDAGRSNFITEECSYYQSVLNNNYELPVHIACACDGIDTKLVKLVSSQLREKNVNSQDIQGNTPLHNVCKYFVKSQLPFSCETVIECLKFFVHEKKCDTNIQNNCGEMPLHIVLKIKNSYSNIPDVQSDIDKRVIKLITSDECYRVNTQDIDGNTPLHIACQGGDSSIVLYLVSNFKCDLNITNKDECLPLHYALSSKLSLDAVKAVINGCTMKCKQNNDGKTPLHIACENIHYWKSDKKKVLLNLICDKVIINVQDDKGNTPLHIASKQHDLETALYLTSHFQCNLDLLNDDHCLPLHYAISSHSDRLCSLDLLKIVSGCTSMHVQNSNGMTPLHIACENRDLDAVKYLVFEKKCIPSRFKQTSGMYDTLDIHLACEDRNDINLLKALANECNVNNKVDRCYDELTPLHVACENGNHLAVKVLVALNCDTLCEDLQGRLSLHVACSKSLECVKEMLPYVTNDVVNNCENNGNTPLHVALKNNQLDIVNFLLSNFQCNFSIKNSVGEFPMHVACRTTLHIVKMMMEKGASQSMSVNCQTKYHGNTLLHIACKSGILDIVRYLTESFVCEPSMTLRNKEGKLPVDYACEHSLEMVKLVSQPCTVEDLVSDQYIIYIFEKMYIKMIERFKYYTPRLTTLDIACKSGSLETVSYLIKERGCTLSALNNDHSALWYACGLLTRDYDGTPRPDIILFLINECGYDPDMTFDGHETSSFPKVDLLPTDSVYPGKTKRPKKNTALHYACKYDYVDIVQILVNCGCDQSKINRKRDSPLHIACRSSLDVTKLLTMCDVNMKGGYGQTPLHIACESKKKEIALYLTKEMNCDVKVRNYKGEYPLHIASLNSLRIGKLVEKIDINCQDKNGNTPLHNACYRRDSDMIQFLLRYEQCRADIPNEEEDLALHILIDPSISGHLYYWRLKDYSDPQPLDPQKKLSVVHLILQRYRRASITTNHEGFTPIDMAIMNGDLKMLEVLLNVGLVDVVTRERLLHKACKYGQSDIVRWLLDHGASTEATDGNEDYPQHICFIHDHSCLQILKQLGPVDICKQDKNNDTILHLACRRTKEDVLQYILQTLGSCDKALLIINNNKETPLHLLASAKSASQETLTLIQCENPNSQDKSGNTALHLACQHGYYELAEHLITNCKCDPNVTNDKGELPLHIAVAQSHPKITELLASPKNINCKCIKTSDSPLHIACQSADLKVINLLLSLHANPSVLNSRGNTPLHIAVAKSLQVVKLVFISDNTSMQNSDGDTPLHIACRGNNLNIALYLLKELKCSVELLNVECETAFHILFNNLSYYQSSTELQKSLLSCIPQCLKNMTNKTRDTILQIACGKEDNAVTIKHLIETLGCAVNAINEHSGATALHFACNSSSLSVVKLVSQCDPTVQITNVSYLPKELGFVSGDTPLHVACRKGNIDVVKHLLRSGHSQALNYPNDFKELPVHLAFAANHNIPQIIKVFIQHKECFDCSATDMNGDTPLHILCKYKPSVSCLQLVVHKLKCKADIPNKEGNLPLHVACQNKHICKGIIKVLCDALGDEELKCRNKNGNTALQELLKCQHDNFVKKNKIQSILHIFIKRGLILLNTDEGQFLNYLHLACRYQKVDVVKYMSKIISTLSHELPLSLLYETCLNHNEGVLLYMLKTFKFDVNVPNDNGDLPLHLAARMKICMYSVTLLVKETKDISYKNNQGETPFHVVYGEGDLKPFYTPHVLFKFLDSKALDLSAMSANGSTPLHCMCRAGKFDDFKRVLKEMKIDANIQDKNGATLLHIACKANNFEAVERLLKSTNANPSIEDHEKQAPITLTTDPRIIKLLIEHGANPQPLSIMHKEYFERFSCENPPPTPVKLLVIGYPSVGKTTLIQSLQNELSEEVISEHFNHTAGIVTTNFSSQHYGVVTFYDFAGQAEYYASHDAVLHSTIKNVPPIFLILIKLNEPTKIILNQTKYWINFMANRCSGLGGEAAHMILVGSHADVLDNRGKDSLEKVSKLHRLVEAQFENIENIILKGSVCLNCTKSKSNEMSRLQELLQKSTSDLREKGVMDFNSHCFYVFLLYMFKINNVLTLGHILRALKSKPEDPINNPLFALPSDRPKVIEMCHDLNEKGHIMFIEHPTINNMSWLILDKAPLLHEILGTLFSPTDFHQHCPLSYSTGVVPLSRFDKRFSTKHSYPSTLSLSFLSRMEYCREIKDPVVLKSIIEEEEFSKLETYYFFPNLVSLERPTDKWSKGTDSKFTYNSGWLIQCKAEGECFSPHFIQAILLRLVFSFTPKEVEYGAQDFETYSDSSESEEEEESQITDVVIKRLCSVWKNGIYWRERSGVKTVVEIINQTTLVLLMQCMQGCEMELVKRRSSIMLMVLSAKNEFCSKAELREYFLHPKVVTHPLPNLKGIQKFLFPFHQVEKSITEKSPCVINDQDEEITLEDLLYFEPFSELSRDVTKVKHTHKLSEEQVSIFNGRKLPQGIFLYCIPNGLTFYLC